MSQGYILTVNNELISILYSSNVFIHENELKEFELLIQKFIEQLRIDDSYNNFMEFLVGKENYIKLNDSLESFEYTEESDYNDFYKKCIFEYTGKTFSNNVYNALCHFNDWFHMEQYTYFGISYDKTYVSTHKIEIYN